MMDVRDAEVGVQAVAARERLAAASGAALLAAGVVLVVAILPAEFGADPTGIGRRLGLTAMNDTARQIEALTASRAPTGGSPTLAPQSREPQHETVEFALAPHDSVEYKYRLEKGQALLFSWKATAPVNYELHAEPDGAPRGYAESYEKKEGSGGAAGTLTAPFPGIHGWYWENPTDQPVTITLSSAGFYTLSHEFRTNKPPRTRMF